MRKILKKILKVFKELFDFIYDIFTKKDLIRELVKRDFKKYYKDSMLGFIWAILEPLSLALIMWFAFTYGLRVGKGNMDMPFICYLFTGNLAWDYFSGAFFGSTNVILEYSFLVKKVDFRLSVLPVVKLLSSSIISLIFFGIVTLILAGNGIYPTFYWFQILYYFFAMMVLTLGVSWITSSITVFVKDIRHIVSIFIKFGFWATPILWNPNMLPEKLKIIVKLNPMAYIVNGYRNSLVYGRPFWQDSLSSILYFWILAFFFLFFGIIVFRKLKPHFADVI